MRNFKTEYIDILHQGKTRQVSYGTQLVPVIGCIIKQLPVVNLKRLEESDKILEPACTTRDDEDNYVRGFFSSNFLVHLLHKL
jgi:hypothetical protein